MRGGAGRALAAGPGFGLQVPKGSAALGAGGLGWGGGRARRGALHPAEARAPEERFACSPVEGGPGVEIRPLFSCSGGQGGLGRQLLL